MSSIIDAVKPGTREQELLDQWIRSTNHNEIGLLDLIVLNEWVTQSATDGERASSD